MFYTNRIVLLCLSIAEKRKWKGWGEGEEEGEREERPVVRGCLFNHVINGHLELRFLADVAEEVSG